MTAATTLRDRTSQCNQGGEPDRPRAARFCRCAGAQGARCAQVSVDVGRRRECVPDTLKGPKQAFGDAGRAQDLTKLSNDAVKRT